MPINAEVRDRTPLHGGRFDIPSGKALSAPVCVDLKICPVKVVGGKVWIKPG